MSDEPPDVVDWRAFGPLLKDAQDRLRSLEMKAEVIHAGIQIIHDDLLTARSEVRMGSNRLTVVETTVREMEGRQRSMDAKLDLILNHLGLETPPETPS
jgi:chromosome segregation ATPase